MMRSLSVGVSGVRSHQLKMDVVGNNIANVNTIGFKSARIAFADQISQLLKGGTAPRDARGGSNPVQVGLGVKVHSVDNNFTQGGLEQTGYLTDLAIQGDGFFTVREGDKLLYTRAGNFTIDADGHLVANGGANFVQGYIADDDGELTNRTLQDINVPLQLKIEARATENVTVYSNLDSNATHAVASLTSAGLNAGGNEIVTSVSGTADDGIGGTHSIAITGSNATQTYFEGTNQYNAGGLTLGTTLGDLDGLGNGVTDTDGFQVTIDQGTSDEVTYSITGLTTTSTVGDLINQLNSQVAAADFDLVGGEIAITRNYAGDAASYNVVLQDTGSSDLADVLFNNGAAGGPGLASFTHTSGAAQNVTVGAASTLVAVDTFTDNGVPPTTTSKTLAFEPDPNTGIMTKLVGLGRGGVEVLANNGFAATTAGNEIVVETEDTDHSTSIVVYDEQGNGHNLSMTFTKTAEQNVWHWEAQVPEPASEMTGHYGTVEFNTDGTLRAWNYENNRGAFTFNPGTSEAPVQIQFDPGTLGGMDGITQTASSFTTSLIDQDGYTMGTLEAIDIDRNGEITGSFSNGQDKRLAAIAIADFNNKHGLRREGDNLWAATDAAGEARYGLAETDHGALIDRGFLEMSNVDLVKEFTDMITAQRGFQANARVITTSDQILQEVTNMKR